MENKQTRRRFIRLAGGTALAGIVSVSFLDCNSTGKKPGNPNNKKLVRTKSRIPPVKMAQVQNRGWYINKRNNKIHFFDKRGYTPALEFMKNRNEFDTFTRNLQPYDAQQLTLEIYTKQVSKKKKDWIGEQTALAFLSFKKFADAFTVVQGRIEKRPVNYRMWDLAGIVAIRSSDSGLSNQFSQLTAKYNSSNDEKLKKRLEKYAGETWQTKIKEKEVKWGDQTI